MAQSTFACLSPWGCMSYFSGISHFLLEKLQVSHTGDRSANDIMLKSLKEAYLGKRVGQQ